jgi:mRNA interferase MazF
VSVRRGDVVLAWYPFSSGTGGKRRPCLVVQSDRDNARLTNTVVVQITSNLRAATEPTQLLIDVTTPEGRQSGLLHDSLVSCNNIATIEQALIVKVIGALDGSMMAKVGTCLKTALELR